MPQHFLFFSFLFLLTKFNICWATFRHMWSHKFRHMGHAQRPHSTPWIFQFRLGVSALDHSNVGPHLLQGQAPLNSTDFNSLRGDCPRLLQHRPAPRSPNLKRKQPPKYYLKTCTLPLFQLSLCSSCKHAHGILKQRD